MSDEMRVQYRPLTWHEYAPDHWKADISFAELVVRRAYEGEGAGWVWEERWDIADELAATTHQCGSLEEGQQQAFERWQEVLSQHLAES